LHFAFCPLPIAYCPLPIAYCPLPIAHCLLLIAFCLLPIAHCPLPIAYCLLPIARCLLPIAHCLLPIAQIALLTICFFPKIPPYLPYNFFSFSACCLWLRVAKPFSGFGFEVSGLSLFIVYCLLFIVLLTHTSHYLSFIIQKS
jgi:hypothetical protein